MYRVTFHHRFQRVNIWKRDTAGCRIIFSSQLAAGETNNRTADSQNEEAFLFLHRRSSGKYHSLFSEPAISHRSTDRGLLTGIRISALDVPWCLCSCSCTQLFLGSTLAVWSTCVTSQAAPHPQTYLTTRNWGGRQTHWGQGRTLQIRPQSFDQHSHLTVTVIPISPVCTDYDNNVCLPGWRKQVSLRRSHRIGWVWTGTEAFTDLGEQLKQRQWLLMNGPETWISSVNIFS